MLIDATRNTGFNSAAALPMAPSYFSCAKIASDGLFILEGARNFVLDSYRVLWFIMNPSLH